MTTISRRYSYVDTYLLTEPFMVLILTSKQLLVEVNYQWKAAYTESLIYRTG